MPEKCRKCPTMIQMLAHVETGNLNPIEAAPSPQGNLVINREKGIYRVATKGEIEEARAKKKNLYISHFSNCPYAKDFRR